MIIHTVSLPVSQFEEWFLISRGLPGLQDLPGAILTTLIMYTSTAPIGKQMCSNDEITKCTQKVFQISPNLMQGQACIEPGGTEMLRTLPAI